MKITSLFRRKPKRIVTKQRNFAGATLGRLFGSWAVSSDYNEDVKSSLVILRDRARDLEKNNDWVRSYIKDLEVNVVGPQGIQIQALFKDDNNKLDVDLNDSVNKAWVAWCRKGVCDVTKKLSFIKIQKMVATRTLVDGECFVRCVYSSHNRFNFSLEFLNPERIDIELNVEDLPDGHSIQMGIEFDTWGAPCFYYIQVKQGTPGSVHAYGRFYIKEKAENIIHLMDETRQTARGITGLASSISRLKMVAGMEEATLVGARLSASKMAMWVPEDGTDVSGFSGEDESETREVVESVEPGAIGWLPPGAKDIKMFDPNVPNAEFSPFIKAQIRGFISGVGGSYHSVSGDYEGASYSSIRQELVQVREYYREKQAWLIDEFIRVVYQKWTRPAVLSGIIEVTEPSKILEPSFTAKGFPWVDPYKDAAAAQLAIKNRTKSRRDICVEQGTTFESVVEQQVYEQELMDSLGLKKDDENFESNTSNDENISQKKEQKKASDRRFYVDPFTTKEEES